MRHNSAQYTSDSLSPDYVLVSVIAFYLSWGQWSYVVIAQVKAQDDRSNTVYFKEVRKLRERLQVEQE